MITTIGRILPHYEDKIEFIHVNVHFSDYENPPCFTAEVGVFLPKRENHVLADIRTEAIQKAREFLGKVLSDHSA